MPRIGSIASSGGANSFYTAASEVAMLALSDIVACDCCYRTDLARIYINNSGANSSMSDWTITESLGVNVQINIPGSSVGTLSYTGVSPQDVTIDASGYYGPSMKFRIRYVNCALSPDVFDLHGDYSNSSLSKVVNNAQASTTPTDYFNGLKISFGSADGHTNYDTVDFEITDSGVILTTIVGPGVGGFEKSGMGALFNDLYIGKDPTDDTQVIVQNSKNNSIGAGCCYAVAIDEDGTTEINSATGKAIEVTNGGSRVARFYNSDIGINTTFPAAKAHITQVAGSNKPVIELDQDDDNEPFIEFDGTTEAGSSKNITSWTTGAALQGYVRVSINGTDYWMPYYSAPTS